MTNLTSLKPQSKVIFPNPELTSISIIKEKAAAESSSRASILARRLLELGLSKYENIDYRVIDLSLLQEEKAFSFTSKKQGRALFGVRHLFNPESEDVFQLKGKTSGKTVYSHTVTIDKYGRRTSSQGSGIPAFNLVFLGCSFTFGEGLETPETFPSQIAMRLPGARAFNLGMPGLSPSHVLRNIRENKERILKETEGLPTIVIYTWIDDHIYRTISSMRYLNRSPDIDPKWDPGVYLEDGKLRMEKTFFEGITPHHFYLYFGKTSTAKLSGVDLPTLGPEQYELVAEVLKETKRLIKELNPKTIGFFVASYPFQNPFFKDLIPLLKKRDIDTLDYSELSFEKIMKGYHNLGTDGHPSAEANFYYAGLLMEDLKEFFPELR